MMELTFLLMNQFCELFYVFLFPSSSFIVSLAVYSRTGMRPFAQHFGIQCQRREELGVESEVE